MDGLTGGLQILTGIEVIRMLSQILADRCSHSQTQVGVDVDLADGHGGSLPELILGYADGTGHIAAEPVDFLHEFLGHGGGAVQHDGKAR